jgi:hypothetical protein
MVCGAVPLSRFRVVEHADSAKRTEADAAIAAGLLEPAFCGHAAALAVVTGSPDRRQRHPGPIKGAGRPFGHPSVAPTVPRADP